MSGSKPIPMFSPDGSMIAFTGEYDGNEDVYVMPAAGGIPKRLTSHPSSDQVAGWSRDGRRILFRSDRNSYSRFNRLFTVATDGGLPTELPLPMAEQGAYLPGRRARGLRPLHQLQGKLAGAARPEALPRRHRIADLDCHARRFVDREGSAAGFERLVADVGGRSRLLPVGSQRPRQPVRVRHADEAGGAGRRTTAPTSSRPLPGPDAIVYEQLGLDSSVRSGRPARDETVEIRVER